MEILNRYKFPPSTYTVSLWFGLIFAWILVFAPHILFSGFIVDDWSVVRSGLTRANFWDNYASWFPLFSNRPAAPLILSAVSLLAGSDPQGYIVANLTIWLASLILIAKVFARSFSNRFLAVFLSLATFPSIASTVIFSIGMQSVGVASILLWSISLFLLDRHIQRRGWLCLAVSHLAVLASLLVYEITLPLLVINLVYPALFVHGWVKRAFLHYTFTYLLPIFGLLTGILLLQKVVMPSFMPVYSRLTPGTFSGSLGSFLSWCWALLVDFPVLIIDSMQWIVMTNPYGVDLKPVAAVVAAIFAFLLFATRVRFSLSTQPIISGDSRRKLLLLSMVLLALVSASLLFVLSGSPAQIGGYGNRGMTSSWILLAMFLAMAADLFRRRGWELLVLVLMVLNAWSFMLQRENYARSWILQNEIAQEVARKIKEINAPVETVSLLGHVPWLVPYSYNDEEVFQNSWDFGGAIWYADHTLNLNAMPLNPINSKKLKIGAANLELTYWKADYSNLWFFEFNERRGETRLLRVTDAQTMKAIAEQVSTAGFNRWPVSLPVRLRDAINNQITPLIVGMVLLLYSLVLYGLIKGNGTQINGSPVLSGVLPGTPCRVCGGVLFRRFKESDILSEKVGPDDFRVTDSSYGTTLAIERCAGCGFLQSACTEVLSYYQQMEDPAYETGRSARTKQFRDILDVVSRWVKSGRLLDIGAGTGMLVEQALMCGFQAEGVEPSEWMARQARERGLPVTSCVLPDIRIKGEYQAITLVDVIEHVDNPADLLSHVNDILAPDGYLLLVTPDVSSIAARLMGSRWWHFRIAHISYFTPGTIELLLQRCGYEVVQQQRTGWYFELAYLLERLGKFIPGEPQLSLPKLFDRIIIPLNLYDSMLLVCRKKQ